METAVVSSTLPIREIICDDDPAQIIRLPRGSLMGMNWCFFVGRIAKISGPFSGIISVFFHARHREDVHISLKS